MIDLFQAYRTFFGKGDALYQLFSPYRICPLGAHVDHQHGLVSGFAFDSGIEFLFSETPTGKVEMCSLSFEGLMTFNVRREIDSTTGAITSAGQYGHSKKTSNCRKGYAAW